MNTKLFELLASRVCSLNADNGKPHVEIESIAFVSAKSPVGIHLTSMVISQPEVDPFIKFVIVTMEDGSQYTFGVKMQGVYLVASMTN